MPVSSNVVLPKLNTSQVHVLKVLASTTRALTATEIVEHELANGLSLTPMNLGPVNRETLIESPGIYAKSLYALGLVMPQKSVLDENAPCKWSITPAGRKMAKLFKAKIRTIARIPPKILDPVLGQMKNTRTYSLDLLTQEDLKEVLKRVGKDYADTPLDNLRVQIANRRKQGLFRNPAEGARRAALSAIRAFGPNGRVKKNLLSEEILDKLSEIAVA